MLSNGGIGSTFTHIIGCLGKKKEQLTIEKIEIEGRQFSGIIDTGATASFVPLNGKIVERIQPNLQITGGKIETLRSEIGSTLYKTALKLKPWGSQVEPVISEALVIDSGTHILGHDIIIGLPELEAFQPTLFSVDPHQVLSGTHRRISKRSQDRTLII